MVYENPKQVEKRIGRLTREIEEIDHFFYGFHKDHFLYMGMLEFKRDDIVRSVVLQLHTSIEDLMTQYLFSEILGTEPWEDGKKAPNKARRGPKPNAKWAE